MGKLWFCVLMCFVVLMQGCVVPKQRHVVTVDAICAVDGCEGRFVVVPGHEFCGASDLLYQELSVLAERALLLAGFEKASNFDDASLAVVLSYSVSDPYTHQYSYSLPSYGQTGVRTTTQAVSSLFGDLSLATQSTPTYGITGYSTHVGTSIRYLTRLTLDGVDMSDYVGPDLPSPMWSIKAESVGGSSDLRYLFPILLGASREYIAKNTGQQIRVAVGKEDIWVNAIKSSDFSPEYCERLLADAELDLAAVEPKPLPRKYYGP